MIHGLKTVLFLTLSMEILEINTKSPTLRQEPVEKSDYRPTKWLTNSALDVWYGNKSFVEVLSREFDLFIKKMALRSAQSPVTVKAEMAASDTIFNSTIEEQARVIRTLIKEEQEEK